MADPKQTAKEIVDKYMPLCYVPWMGGKDEATQEDCAKEAAILHCQCIIDELENLCKPEYTSFFHGEMGNGTTMDGYELKEFYENIITEIKQL